MAGSTLLAALTVSLFAATLAAHPSVRNAAIKEWKDCTHSPSSCAKGLTCDGKRSSKRCIKYKPAGMPCPANEDFWICEAGLTCQNDVCKISAGKDCTANTEQCAAGLACDGKRAAKRCITYKAAGMGCPANEDFWICASGLTCESDVCKIPVGSNCATSTTNCVAGAECTGSGSAKKCTPTPAKLGETCSASTKCSHGLTCDGGVCKIPAGKDCTANPKSCATGLSCDGKRAAKRCITYKAAGMGCPANEDFWICASGLTCEADVCKIPVGSNCAASTTNCVAGAECTGSGSAKKCTPTPAKLRETCSASTKCANGLICDGGVCKLPAGKDCTANPKSCATGLSCDGKRAAKRCITYKAAGMGCPANEDFWICASGLTCEADVCKIPVGSNCAASTANCVAGAECTGSGSAKKCTPVPAKLGETCSASTKCAHGLTCDGGVCKLTAGKDCTANPKSCATGLSCDGKRAAKRCITYKAAGMGCPAKEDFWICASGLTCEADVCKIPVGSNCAASTANCVAGAECTGSGSAKKCTPTPAKLGETCSASTKCAHGLTCDGGVCKLPAGKDCTANPKSCASGLSCDGKRAAKRCITYKAAGMGCPAKEDFWICASGLTCEADVCKIPVGSNCAASTANCVAGAECTGSGSAKKCTPTPAKLGETCSASTKCAHGLTCDGGVCKLPAGKDCTANPKSCATGLSCDGKRAAKRCITYKPAGMRCPANEDFWICAPGLTCESEVCKVSVGGSCADAPDLCVAGSRCKGNNRRGRTCLKTPGRLGEECDANSPCRRRFVCDGTCKLGINAPCRRAPTMCAGNLACVGVRRDKVCRPLRAEGRRCGAIGFLQCAPGLSCIRNKCVRGTQAGGMRCGRGLFCEAGLVCAGHGRGRMCVEPMDIGDKCGVDPYWVCASTARCVRSRCRAW